MKKKGNKKMPTPRYKLIHNLHLCLFQVYNVDVKMFFLCLMHSQQTNEILKQNKDVGMGL